MILGLTLHLGAVLLLGSLIDALFGRWVCRGGVPVGTALGVGVGLLLGRLVWLIVPFFNPGTPLRLPLNSTFRLVEFWWGWTLVLVGGVFVGWGLVRSWWAIRQLRAFREENSLARLEIGCNDFFKAHRIRLNLEQQYRCYAQAPSLVVRFSWLTVCPIITGTLSPILYVPMPLLGENQDAFLEPVLEHEAGHIRLRHHWIYAPLAWLARLLPFLTSLVGSIGRIMNLRVNRDIHRRVDEAAWNLYVAALEESPAVDWSPALAIPHLAGGESFPLCGPGTRKDFLQIGLALGFFLVGSGLSASVGQVSLRNIKEFLMKNQITGYDARVWDPRVSIQALPGKGGQLPDGIVLDASRATGEFQTSFLGANLRPLLPVDAKAARVSFDYEAWNGGGAPGEWPTVSTRTLEYFWDGETRRHCSWIFDFRWSALEAGKGHVSLSLKLHNPEPRLPASAEKLVGPDIGVPAGWRLVITQWEIAPLLASEVAPTKFPEDVDGYVAIATRCHRPSPIHLHW